MIDKIFPQILLEFEMTKELRVVAEAFLRFRRDEGDVKIGKGYRADCSALLK